VAVTTATELGVATPSIGPDGCGLPAGVGGATAVLPLSPLQPAEMAISAASMSTVVSSLAVRASVEILVMK